jgi:hypothetical protein
MALTQERPALRSAGFRPKIRPVSGFPLRQGCRRAPGLLTADRSEGVGRPTTDRGGTPDPTPESLVREAADTALESLETLERQVRDVARRFRRGARAEAQVGLLQIMQSTQTLLKLAAVAAGVGGTDLDTLCERHALHPEAQTHRAMNELIHYQMAEDWMALAGVLDQLFMAALGTWRRVFIALGGAPTGPYGHAA